MSNSWHIALIANLKYHVAVRPDAPPDALAEYDSEVTVQAIDKSLCECGHRVTRLEADETLLDTVRQTQPDICFNIAEGLRGDARESHVPALLEMLGIPYTGSKVLTHALSLDKGIAKRIWRDHHLPTAPFQVFRRADEPLGPGLEFPLFVKPVREGSGMGISPRSIVRSEAELRHQVAWVVETYHQPALVESYLPGREFTVGMLGNTLLPGEKPPSHLYNEHGFHLFPVMEIDTQVGAVKGVYNTEAKSYQVNDSNAPGYRCPADISLDLKAELERLAVAAFEAIDGLDVGRVDFRLDAAGRPCLVEINTLPGLNPGYSDLCLMMIAEGLFYETAINEILSLAVARYRREAALCPPHTPSRIYEE